jgi:hypothetical protein
VRAQRPARHHRQQGRRALCCMKSA